MADGEQQLPHGPIGAGCRHLCVDMQNMFAQETDWHAPWMERVLPVVRKIAEHRPERNVFTRFIPLADANEGRGTWRRYYERWPAMTTSRLGPEMIDLLPPLAELVPPGVVIDKQVYSPWDATDLDDRLRHANVDTLIVSGTETDVCVLASVMGAVDRGYRVIVPRDAICSSADATHDAILTLYQGRYGQQVEIADSEAILRAWR